MPCPTPVSRSTRRSFSRLRLLMGIGSLAGLAACAGQTPGTSPIAADTGVPVTEEAADYRAHAKSYYAPPGSASDPWGPYIAEASKRFDVPEPWIRAVMTRESGGRLYASDGSFVTSVPGAMGLMQLMPPTYDDMRSQYSLGSDAFDPHDNIIAGTAYLRQMYDIYGSPGFLAAYNDGPGMLDRYLRQGRTLPRETRRYVAAIGTQIAGIWPNSRSAADLLVAQHDSHAAMYASAQTTSQTRNVRAAWSHHIPEEGADQPVQVAEAADTPSPAPSYTGTWHKMPEAAAPAATGGSVAAAWAARGVTSPAPAPAPVQVASAEDDAPATPHVVVMPAMATTRPHSRFAFHIITPAMAEPSPLLHNSAALSHGAGLWSIQVGAFNSASQATQAAGHAHAALASATAHTQVASVRSGHAQLYRARVTGLSHDAAIAACRRLSHNGPCNVVSPT